MLMSSPSLKDEEKTSNNAEATISNRGTNRPPKGVTRHFSGLGILPHLSTYLGHVSIEETATYLRMTAELLSEANTRFESYSLGEGHHA
jgi:hypothetical protein